VRRRSVTRRWLSLVLGVTLAVVAAGCSDWTTYHRDPGRSGADLSAPSIVPAVRAWTSPGLDGLVYAEPLVYRNRVYVATENDSVYALDLATGAVVWRSHLGTPVPLSALPCGNIGPLGITGTPVIDPVSNVVFVVAELGGTMIQHALVGLDADRGDPRVLASGDPFPVIPATHQQRAALALGNGRVYWAYGGLAGDCGTYHGTVLSVRTDGSAPLEYVVPTHNQGAIWGPSGPAIDPAGNVWVATGNGACQTTFDHSNSVIKLSPTLQELGVFAPANWAALNTGDLDLGSTGPLMLPGALVFQVGKSGDAYLVRQSAPGGIGGQVASLSIGCGAYGGDALFSAGTNGVIYVPCADGTRALTLGPGPALRSLWHGPSDANGSPVFGGSTVWVVAVDHGLLYALNPLDGSIKQTIVIGHARHFTSPTIAGSTVVVATDTTVQAFHHA
jgi:outer membrane protein assembly factor BamB